MKNIIILTGAGMSAESGIQTFRGADGLWEGHNVMDVASPEGWNKNQELVLKFYNDRRKQLKEVVPNAGHLALVDLEKHYNTTVITQNVDDLHERAGSSNVIHLHGELRKVRSTVDASFVKYWEEDINQGDLCPHGGQLRPHIVWFGEAVPMIETAVDIIQDADIVLIIGTSMKVYPAAGLVGFAPRDAEIYYVDPYPTISSELAIRDIKLIEDTAVNSLPSLVKELCSV